MIFKNLIRFLNNQCIQRRYFDQLDQLEPLNLQNQNFRFLIVKTRSTPSDKKMFFCADHGICQNTQHLKRILWFSEAKKQVLRQHFVIPDYKP
jgi:hypothetical protein